MAERKEQVLWVTNSILLNKKTGFGQNLVQLSWQLWNVSSVNNVEFLTSDL